MSTSTSAPSSQSRQRQATQGKFEDGLWYCGCNPPQEAVFLQVKKDNENKGRFFFTCPKPRQSQCRFYLWEDEAKDREKEMLPKKSGFANNTGPSNNQVTSNNPGLSNNPVTRNIARGETSRGETPQSEVASNVFYSPRSSVFPTQAPGRGMFRDIPRVPNASWSSEDDSDVTKDDQYPATPAPKRKRSEVEAGAGADLSDVDSDDARMLVEAADRSERQHQSSSQKSKTSSQRSQLSDAPPASAPGTWRGNTRAGFGFGGLPTPQSGNSFTSLGASSEPGAKRFRTANGAAAAAAAAAVPSTPTPARSRNALASGGGGQPRGGGDFSEDDADITVAVLGLLKSEPVSAQVKRAVRDTLNLHALRGRGVERARDLVREGLKKKDGQIAELQARVVKLESERQMRRQVLRKAASDIDALCGDEREDCGD